MKFPLRVIEQHDTVYRPRDVMDADNCSILRVALGRTGDLKEIVRLANRGAELEQVEAVTAALVGFDGYVLAHADGERWRTLDSMGAPAWTNKIEEALCFRLRKHADLFATDDPDDVRIKEVRI